MFRQKCAVIANQKMTAPGHFILKLRNPLISSKARPGQFVQILCADTTDPLLPRPFSFLTAGAKDFSILYQVVGKGTELLSRKKKGDAVWAVGPLGNGFTLAGSKDLFRSLLVGGGVGIPPLVHLAEELLKKKVKKENIHVFLGARNKSLLLCEKDFKKLGVYLHIATDDGSKGSKGFVTKILEEFISSDLKIFTCGPTPMLKAVSAVAHKHKIPCEVSVEEPMACGFGACLGCAIKVKNQGDRRRETGYKNTYPVSRILSPEYPSSECRFAIACTEGPVFNSEDIVW